MIPKQLNQHKVKNCKTKSYIISTAAGARGHSTATKQQWVAIGIHLPADDNFKKAQHTPPKKKTSLSIGIQHLACLKKVRYL